MSTKVIFLDIDGVLCTRRSHLAYGKEGGIWYEWDTLAVEVIRKMAKKGVIFVLSSTWRKPPHVEDFWKQWTKYGLEEHYLWERDWMTPIGQGVRGEEIKDWLNRHPEVTDYKIVDDNNDMLEEQMSHCIFTDAEDGMTSDNIKKLLNWSGVWKA